MGVDNINRGSTLDAGNRFDHFSKFHYQEVSILAGHMAIQVLAVINRRTIHSAGPRYTPGLDTNAPNVQIATLLSAIDGLACNDRFLYQIDSMVAELNKRWARSAGSLVQKQVIEKTIVELGVSLRDFRAAAPGSSSEVVAIIRSKIRTAEEHLKHEDGLLDEQEKARRDEIQLAKQGDERQSRISDREDSLLRTIDDKRRAIWQLETILRECLSFCDGPSCALRFTNTGLLKGAWGTGKTHFLCDVASRFIAEGRPALVVLARDFDPGEYCGDSLARATGLGDSFGELLQRLNEAGLMYRQRALLLIDGINESDIKKWRRDIKSMLDAIRTYDYVGLILSCREPFEKAIFSSKIYAGIPKLQHTGFDEIEFDAQKAFFDYYDIPLPEVPLLAEEFSRPLTLKILCQAFQKLPRKEKEKGFFGISSGQKGMTYVLEQFVCERTKKIEVKLGLPPKFCWNLLKGDRRISEPEMAGLAPYMALFVQESVPYDHVVGIVKSRPVVRTKAKAKKLLQLLVREGVIYHHITWRGDSEGGPIEVIGLPYQRFSDHLIARHLLEKYLDRSSVSSVRKSLRKGSHLGRVFELNDTYYRQYAIENWAEALIVEFPEFVKNVLPEGERELYYYLPKAQQDLVAYFQPFVSGLVWRAPTSICSQTDKITGAYFWNQHEPWRRDMGEALISVATKPKHPYSGVRLFRNLSRIAMPKRDLTWSEFLRGRHYGGTAVERVVVFYERPVLGRMSSETAGNAVALLASFLPTTDRLLRDRATKGLVHIGEKHPRSLFDFAKEAITFNDPYVLERVIAAAYGVAMCRYADPDPSFHREFLTFAEWIVKEFFLPGGKARTHHALLRGYACGIVELAKFLYPAFVRKRWAKYLSRPFEAIPDPFPEARRIPTRSVKKKTDGAMMMDFENYTLGRLIPNRANYDMKHAVYRRVRKQIEWRMVDLGYDQALFKQQDSMIGRDNWREREDGRKVDRYGKKYSWIAYFEMYGLREARGKLPDSRADERSSDCDIDPSFPEYSSKWSPDLPGVFSDCPADVVGWLGGGRTPNYDAMLLTEEIDGMKGPWVALDGYVQQTQPDDMRQIFTFVRGLLTSEDDAKWFAKEFHATRYPGNSAIPKAGEDYYTYAGEVPWSVRFAPGLRDTSGMARRQIETAFDRSEQQIVHQKVKDFWKHLYALLPACELADIDLRDLLFSKDDPKLQRVIEAVERANSVVQKNQRVRSIYDLAHPPTLDEVTEGFRLVSKHARVSGPRAEIPVWTFGWESYHSALNQFTGFDSPAPALCQELGLRRRGHFVDCIDVNGQVATVFRKWKDAPRSHPSHITFIREDLLLAYLKKTAQVLVLAIWGEREFPYDLFETYRESAEVKRIWGSHRHIHKQLRLYSQSGFVVM